MTTSRPIEVIAHRGYSSRAPENTLAALELAMEAGADGVEWDVQVAACGTPVLFHDVHLGRTTNGVGPVNRRTLSQLRALDAGSWFSKDFTEERIPTLEEALSCIKGRTERVFIEIKGYRELHDLDRMVGIVEKTGTESQSAFISMDWTTLDRIRSQAPELTLGFIVEKRGRFDKALEKATACPNAFLDLDHRLVLQEPDLVRRAAEKGLETCVWTVDGVEEAASLLDVGVFSFTTNEVGQLLKWKESAE